MVLTNNTKFLLGLGGAIALAIVLISWAVQPDVPDFSQYEAGAERKQEFFNYFLPLIEQHNMEVQSTREQLLAWNRDREDLGWWDQFQLGNLAEDYRLKEFDISSDDDWDLLLLRVDIVPPSLALAQAAKESGWGTSRFGQQGNNFYGQWCYQEGCGMVPKNRGTGKAHEVAVFDSPGESVESYINNLNSHKAYRPLRQIRAELRAVDRPITGIELAAGLGKYSQRGDAYVTELRSLIRRNDLMQYDTDQYGTDQYDTDQ